jgi:glyoxylase-like metal-dependent hydrolase (beta-lactamase superfamily II)
MADVKVLVEGYVREEGEIEMVSSTTTLIRDSGKNIIVDPGMNEPMLKEAFRKENLTYDDIDYVILTHTHTDHMLLTALFRKSRVVDPWSIFTFDGKSVDHDGRVPGTGIELIKTPGHDPSHICVVAKSERGVVVVAGDLFWWGDDEEQKTDRESLVNHEDPYMKNKEQLIESRKRILEIADYIIPGHGRMFRVERHGS